MIQPFLSDIVLAGVGVICVLFVLLLILDGLLQERAARRERQARSSRANGRQLKSSGTWMAGGKFKASRRHLAVLFACFVVIAALMKGHGGSKASATTNSVATPTNQPSSNALPAKAAAELPDTNSIIFQYQPPASGTKGKTSATNVISVDLYRSAAQPTIFGNLPRQ